MTVKAAIANGNPSRSRRSRRKIERRLVAEARPDEQAGQEEEHRHEEAVGGENDHVETDPRLGIGVTEIGVGNDGVVEQHHQRQEGAGAIEREVARFDLWRRADVGGRRVEIDVTDPPPAGWLRQMCSREPNSARPQ